MKKGGHLVWMLILIASLEAILQIELPAIISSNRILQCNTGVSLWGWAKKRAKITLEVSWLDEKLIVSTDKKVDGP